MVRLTTLGSVRIESSEGAHSTNGSQQAKRMALLAYLAVARPRGAHRRDTILGLLWPELDQERARGALRQALHGIRKALGANTVLSRGTELLELNANEVTCDFWELDAAVTGECWDAVIDCYAGDLLAGLFVGDAPAFESWVDGERERVRGMVRTSAWRVAEGAKVGQADARMVADVARAVRLATSLSRFDESAIRRGMRLLAQHGARAEAIALYQRFAAEARSELDAEPSPETSSLAAALRGNAAESAPLPASIASRTAPSVHAMPAKDVQVGVHRSALLTSENRESAHRESAFRAHWFSRPRRSVVAFVSAVVALLAAAKLAPSANASLDPRRVSIAAFRGDNEGTDSIARRVTLEVRSALAAVGGASVLAGEGSMGERALDGAGTIVRGVVHVDEGTLELRGEIVDVATGTIVRAVVERAPPGEPLSVSMGAFNDRLSAALSSSLYPGWGNTLSQPPSYAAYRFFVDGMRRIKAEDHASAIASFQRAYAQDSSFTAAGLLAGMELYQVGRFAAADSLAGAIGERRAALPPVDERLLEWLVRSLRGDRIGARGAMQGVVALAPDADLAWLQLAIDNVETARPEEALQALDRIAPGAEFGEAWPAYWATRIEALHLLGDHARELRVTREGLKRHPETAVLVNYELRALAALGRVDEVSRAIDAGMTRAPDPEITIRQVARELVAHGHAAQGAVLLKRAVQRYESRSDSTRAAREQRGSLARALYLLDDRERARTLYDSLLKELPGCVGCRAALGVLAARAGDRIEAMKHDEVLARVSKPFLFGAVELLRARIAAALGETARATMLLNDAFAAGAEFDVLTHADADLAVIRPDSLYKAFARVR